MKIYFRPCASAAVVVRKKTGSHHGATLLAIAVFTASVNAAILDEARQAEPGPSVLALPGGPDPRHRLVRILPHLTGEEGVPEHFMAAMRGALMEFPTPRLRGLSGARTALQIPALHKRRSQAHRARCSLWATVGVAYA